MRPSFVAMTLDNTPSLARGTVVTKSIADFALVVGNPAKQVGWMSTHGHRLQFDAEGMATCPESGETYHLSQGAVKRVS